MFLVFKGLSSSGEWNKRANWFKTIYFTDPIILIFKIIPLSYCYIWSGAHRVLSAFQIHNFVWFAYISRLCLGRCLTDAHLGMAELVWSHMKEMFAHCQSKSAVSSYVNHIFLTFNGLFASWSWSWVVVGCWHKWHLCAENYRCLT